jgi:hypothetical protein
MSADISKEKYVASIFRAEEQTKQKKQLEASSKLNIFLGNIG